MKRLVFLGLLFLFVVILLHGFLVIDSEKSATPSMPSPSVSQKSTALPKDLPKKLIIEKNGVNADLEYVGMDQKGNMDVPKNPSHVAWYQLGFVPGEKGSAVMAGHFDDPDGNPAVFYQLGQLQKGDKIQVVTQSGKSLVFTVEKLATYPFDTFPLQDVFNTIDRPRLNLITCDGVFDKSQETYLQRLVVYAVVK